MAAVGPQEASSSTFRCSYHVFLSFRGKDTRKTFTDHLYTALVHAGIHTFRDDDELQRGENIESKLQKAIKESKISIVVFSTNYASSRWCLDELLKILECQKTSSNHTILPVFYHVLPTQVRFQTGSFAEAFARHVEREGMEKVERWKEALREVADMSGMELQDGHEAKFIKSIVKEIGIKLNRTVLSVALHHPIGIDSRVSAINRWVQDGSNDVNIMAIYGIGGIGKTTIAKAVYNLNFEMFDRSSFLANIRDVSEQPNGLVRLQRQLLSDILRGRKQKIYNVDEGAIKIRDAISCKKILLVLDDVDQLDNVNALLGMRDWFYRGTKIIITTRHKGLLNSHDVCKKYKVEELNNDESLELFSWHAFGQDFPSEGYMELSQGVLKHCGGLPLALQVLGSSLYGKSSDIWKSALKKLETIPNNQILKKLKISYDSLQDDHDKSLFLDIACFFVGMDKDYITPILDACDVCTNIGIQNLIDRCLLTIDVKNKLTMHQLLQHMGREIIRQESPEEPGKRSRLWNHKDVLNVLREKTGSEKIKGLIFNSHMSKEENLGKTSLDPKKGKRKNINESADKCVSLHEANSLKRRCLGFFSWLPTKSTSTESFSMPDEMKVKTEAFSAMQRLRLLELNYARVCGGFVKFPRTLKWLCWRGFSLRSIPPDFHLENLVALDMRYSSMELVWRGGTMCLRLLKILDLSYSQRLIRTPDFSEVPNLEQLILKYCERLGQVHDSIGCLERLVFLNLKGCKNLKKLPQSIGLLKSLETLILVDCSKLDELPNEMEKMQLLTVFHADGINQLPSGEAQSRNAFLWSWLSKTKPLKFSLASLPRSLVDLSLAGCNLSDDAFMMDFGGMPLLQILDLSRNSICSLPESIIGLNMLEILVLVSCNKLQSLPELQSSLQRLITYNCSSLQRMSNLPNLQGPLMSVNLEGCEELVEIRGLFKLEPIGKFDIHMVYNLGLFNDLERLQGVEILLRNNLARTAKKGPIQGLDEFGIFSTFIAGSDVPGCFSIKNSGNAISFTVTSLCDFEIRGLNIFVVYADIERATFYITIINKTKGMKWVYGPTFFGIPEANQDMIWLSHWEFGNQLGFGDEVDLSVDANILFIKSDISAADKVKECGIQLVYRERVDKSSESPINSNLSRRNVIGGDLSAYETRKGSYFLCHHNYYWSQSKYGLHRFGHYDLIFEFFGKTTGLQRCRCCSCRRGRGIYKEEHSII